MGTVSPWNFGNVDKQTQNAMLVKQTLDYMNTNSYGQQNADYAFQTSVLQAGAIGKGLSVNQMV